MTGKDLIFGLDFLEEEFIDQAEFGQFSPEAFYKASETARPRMFHRAAALAAVIGLLCMLIGCGVVYLMTIQDMKLGDRQITQKLWDVQQGTYVHEARDQQVLTTAGLKGSDNYRAAMEWYEFLQSYDPNWKIYRANKDAGIPWECPEKYRNYNIYTEEMAAKLDEITEKYGLRPLGVRVDCSGIGMMNQGPRAVFAYLGIEGVVRTDEQVTYGRSDAGWYEGGVLTFLAHMRLADEEEYPGYFLMDYSYAVKGCFNPDVIALEGDHEWEEWNYTTAAGDEVLVIRSPTYAWSWIFCDRADATVSVQIETIREIVDGENSRVYTMTDEQLKRVLDHVDFSVEPQPGNAEYRSPTG